MQFKMGPRPRCYIPSFMQIGPAVPEKKIFEGFLLYMSMVAILVMWPGPHMQTFVPPSHEGSIWNLTSIGPVVPEEKTFENVNTRHTDRQTDRQQPCHMISSPMSLRLRWAKKAIMFRYHVSDNIFSSTKKCNLISIDIELSLFIANRYCITKLACCIYSYITTLFNAKPVCFFWIPV